jgi:bifunctional DNA primase/polymerase-like protein
MARAMSNLDEALRMAAAGVAVHPCKWDDPDVKKPFVTGWKTLATNIASEVQAFWDAYPNAIPGIAMGKSGLIAIDLDVKKFDGVAAFDDLLNQHGELPRCPATRTPSGGFHLIFRQPAGRKLGNSPGALPKGIDVRGDGGNLIAPGAVLASGEFYEGVPAWPNLAESYAANAIPELPAWLIAILEAPRAGHHRQERVPGFAASAADYVDDITAHRRLNNAALQNLDAWVPQLGLFRLRQTRAGYEAVATWRPSSRGRPDQIRKTNLKFSNGSVAKPGIVDFGVERKYTPLDLVTEALGCDLDEAFGWLAACLGWGGCDQTNKSCRCRK